eukprot:TRINITY_DN1719_c0_g1_i16.p3 TRINITY_DN1719_c0_g1~~TRINITY_DN1719_c0_g1_i16.p3  ORF type:complete len:142 (-),score=43.14 TRINITY_DN1719_c0_g1_i16:375-800(-)
MCLQFCYCFFLFVCYLVLFYCFFFSSIVAGRYNCLGVFGGGFFFFFRDGFHGGIFFFFFFFSSRRRHTRCREVSWARRCVQETGINAEYMGQRLSYKGQTVDALVPGGDERRGKLRQASGSCLTNFDPEISEWGNLSRRMV